MPPGISLLGSLSLFSANPFTFRVTSCWDGLPLGGQERQLLVALGVCHPSPASQLLYANVQPNSKEGFWLTLLLVTCLPLAQVLGPSCIGHVGMWPTWQPGLSLMVGEMGSWQKKDEGGMGWSTTVSTVQHGGIRNTRCIRKVLQVGERVAGRFVMPLTLASFAESVHAEEGGGVCLCRTFKQCLTFLLNGAP